VQISDQKLTAFQTLWKKYFHEDISKEKALEEGIKLINLVRIVYQPITKKQYRELLEYKRKNKC